MHELGICDALLKMVRNVARQEKLTAIKRITLEIGTLSGVVPNYMTDCWEAVTDGTELEDVEFIVEELQGTARCLACEKVFPSDVNHLRCPHCGSDMLTPLTGRDLTLKEILAE